ncbi:hypothetical protein BV22DRAFT_1134619 [Leucogyrophana mollusca]|uniref:Uncharacterized protein n=1 Tax=Leucogyrophana mollusca TaxID=85980 RepID=A0ACB8AYP1_9AGAM|nr:hypothetical protein BV22DRAFT_1134619 [Leucogyrophana mollusca]
MPRTPPTSSTRQSRGELSPYARLSSPSLPPSEILPSSSTHIISATDAEALRQLRTEIVCARQEATRLRRDAAKAKRDTRKTQREKETIEEDTKAETGRAQAARKANEQFLATRDTVLACPGCEVTMQRPFTLSTCGHTFCHRCLRIWFQASIAQRLQFAADAPARLKKPPYTAAQLDEMVQHKYLVYVWYTCPLCDKNIDARPIETRHLKELVEAVNEAFGTVDVPHDIPLDPWADSWIDPNSL